MSNIIPSRPVSHWLINGKRDDSTFDALVESVYKRTPTRRSQAYERLSGRKGRTMKNTKIGKRDIRVVLQLLRELEMEPAGAMMQRMQS